MKERPLIRILVADDSPSILADFEKILHRGAGEAAELQELRAELFGSPGGGPPAGLPRFELETFCQGLDAIEGARAAREHGAPFQVAFVDMRMPPGIDGLETIERLFGIDPEIQVVICTAFSDHSWEQITRRLGATDRLLVLKKPFDAVEVRQFAASLGAKWQLGRRASQRLGELERCVAARTGELDRANAALAAEVRRVGEANEALSVAMAAAQCASRSKTDFLTNISHEIRTPMTAILGFSELLTEPGVRPEEVAEHVGTIRRNGEHLLALLNDLLDVAKIEAGALTLERRALSPRGLLAEVAELLRPRAQAKSLALETCCQDGVPEWIESDPLRLRQVLINLVGNAVKFTERGQVRLRLRHEIDAEGPWVVFEVQDTGIGLSQTQLRRMFRPFSQADGSTSRRFGGTGLGLHICKQLAELLGGGVDADSTAGVGSLFRLRVPCGPATTAPAGAEATRTAASLRDLRVLLVEDGQETRRKLRALLEQAGAQVELLSGGEETLARLAPAGGVGPGGAPRPAIDLVLMGLALPGLDGLAVTRALRAAGCTLPIVARGLQGSEAERERCLKAGCDAVLGQAGERAELLEVCARLGRAPGAALPSRAPADAPAQRGAPGGS